MSREGIVVVSGVLLTIVPYLGVPTDWKKTITLILGVFLIVIGYSLRRSAFLRSIETHTGERRADAFVESVATSVPDTKTDVARI
jgi:uncharacterized membrane protein